MEYNNYVDKEMNQVINKVFKAGVLDISKFKDLDHLIERKIIYTILEKIAPIVSSVKAKETVNSLKPTFKVNPFPQPAQ